MFNGTFVVCIIADTAEIGREAAHMVGEALPQSIEVCAGEAPDYMLPSKWRAEVGTAIAVGIPVVVTPDLRMGMGADAMEFVRAEPAASGMVLVVFQPEPCPTRKWLTNKQWSPRGLSFHRRNVFIDDPASVGFAIHNCHSRFLAGEMG
jgi:hypothetical protein